MAGFGGEPDPANLAFDEWLERVCTSAELEETDRRSQLITWEQAPAARENHPREEHLVPLHVCYGIGGGAATRHFDGEVLGKRVAGFSWT